MEDKKDGKETLLVVRDKGRFIKGNQEGIKFQKGSSGRPKGIKHKKTRLAKEWARDILHTDPETGKKLTTAQVMLMLAREACKSPRLRTLLLDHCWGKPTEYVEQQHKIITLNVLEREEKDTLVGEDQTSLPAGESENET